MSIKTVVPLSAIALWLSVSVVLAQPRAVPQALAQPRAVAQAQAPAVPAPLAPWVPWVLEDVPERACAFVADRAQCRWPGRLELELDAQGGRFAQVVRLDRAELFVLPGSAARWPLAVHSGPRALAVLDQDGDPSVMLAAGVHRLEGRFEWKALPERLELPADTAAIALSVHGQEVRFPKRDERGELWLQGSASAAEAGEQLGLSVSRRIEDGVPLIVITRIKLKVSGRAREVNLGPVLLAGTTPLSLQSELPVRLEERGELRVQVHAGSFTVELRARASTPPDELAFRAASEQWPPSEIWVWQANEALRQVELSGAAEVEPSRTELDSDWRGLPAFVLHAGASLKFATTRRGEATPPPNRIALARELWLDLDGGGYTVRDSIDAELRQGFRLDLLHGDLGHVAADGEDQLITKTADGKHAGVELRKHKQTLVAESRLAGAVSVLPAVGWSEDVQSLHTTLHLGPGYRLLAADGVDAVSESWIEGWDLFDFLFVLLVAFAAAKLTRYAYVLLALAALVLCHGEDGAPEGVWFALLAAIALLRVLPAGFFRNLVRAAYALSVVTMILIAIPFAVDQVRIAIYPQLALPWTSWRAMDMNAAPQAEAFAPASPAPSRARDEGSGYGRGAGGLSKSRMKHEEEAPQDPAAAPDWLGSSSQALRQDPEATVQTGPGVPSWSFRDWTLRWSGPVDHAHSVKLYLLSPGQNRVLSFLRVLLIAWLIAVLLRAASFGRDRPGGDAPAAVDAKPAPAAAAAAMLLACVLAPLFAPAFARADLPDQALLDKLRERLTKPAECRPNCASIDELRLSISDEGLTLLLRVHAAERTSVRLPGPAATFVPAKVVLDKKADPPMVLLEDGFLHVRVEPGVHALELSGPLPATDTLALAFGDRPHRTRVEAERWKVDGVREDGSVEGALQLSRLLSSSDRALQSAALPAYLALERTLELGPSWTAHGKLTRVSPTGTPIVVRVPLLPGEAVTESSLEVHDGALQIAFGRDDQVVEWSSRLAPTDKIELRAAKDQPWSERWQLLCGPIWRCDVQGLTPVRYLANDHVQLELAPWPGESASVHVQRPEPAKGQSVTIDTATLDVTPGVRMQRASLELHIRNSRGATQTLSLPAGARVQQLSLDEQERPVHQRGDRLSLTLEPGEHTLKLQWQEARGLAFLQRSPAVALGRPAANASVLLHVPQERWLLWASGPAFGPAILFWGYLLCVLGLALVLGRVRLSPLRTHQWLLLAAGMTQLPAPAALCIVAWFFIMAYRGRMPEQSRWLHNLGQLALVGFSLIALGCLYYAVHTGLLVRPDMQVMGANSSGELLRWYVDRVAGALPTATIVSAPLWTWRLLMLLWSLWLAAKLLRWLPWAFGCFRHGGLWKRAQKQPKTPRPPPPAGPLSSIPPAAPAAGH